MPGPTFLVAKRVRVDVDADPIDDAVVVIERERVREVVPRSTVAIPAAAPVVDASRWTVLPGFVDMHLHITTRGAGRLHEEADKPRDEALAQGRGNLANALGWGVTTVRDAGSWNDVVLALRDEIDDGRAAGPRVMPCGSPVTSPRGHLWWFGGEARGPDEARAVVRRQADLGMTHVKVMATGGWATPGSDPRQPQFGVAELRAIVDEARRRGIGTMAHLASLEGVRRAVEAGVDTLEHCMLQRPDGTWVYPPDLIRAIVERGFWVDPTPAWHYRTVTDPPPGTSRERVAELRAVRTARIEIYRRLLDAGHTRWLTGTDTGGTNPQDYFPLVCQIMVEEIGMSPRDVVRAATSAAAEALGLAGRVGTLRAGAFADLVALDGDPVEDITAVWRPRSVMARGRAVASPGHAQLASSHGGGWE